MPQRRKKFLQSDVKMPVKEPDMQTGFCNLRTLIFDIVGCPVIGRPNFDKIAEYGKNHRHYSCFTMGDVS